MIKKMLLRHFKSGSKLADTQNTVEQLNQQEITTILSSVFQASIKTNGKTWLLNFIQEDCCHAADFS